jgi:hypothetical protein
MFRLLPRLCYGIPRICIEASVALARVVQQRLGPVPVHHVRHPRPESLGLFEVVGDDWQSGVAVELALVRLAVPLELDVQAALNVRAIRREHDQQMCGDVAHCCLAGIGKVDLVAVV